MPQSILLCYHGVSDTFDRPFNIKTDALERQLRSLVRRRFRPVTAFEALAGSGRRFHVTFDDAYKNLMGAVPTLERLGVPATVFVVTDLADDGLPFAVPELAAEAEAHPDEMATMDWDDLRALVERGFEIGSHTASHPHLPGLSDTELDRELRDSRSRCEEELDRRCRYVAYPYGEHDERVQRAARRAGYEAAFALGSSAGSGRWAVPRVDLYRGNSLVAVTVKTSFAGRPSTGLVRRLRKVRGETVETLHSHGWLAAVVPADARRFRVSDPNLALTLTEAGAQLVDRAPDVEIGPPARLQGDAPVAIVDLKSQPHDSGSLAIRASRRFANSLWLQIKATAAMCFVRRRGYAHVQKIRWDIDHSLRLPGDLRRPTKLAEYLPQRALVIGSHSPQALELLDTPLAHALRASTGGHGRAQASIRAGGVVPIVTDAGILRVAMGAPCWQIRAQLSVLQELREQRVDPIVAERIPWPIASGKSGLAEWSLEPKIPGKRPRTLGPELLADCVDFLVALKGLGPNSDAGSMSVCAQLVASFRPDRDAVELLALGTRLDDKLAEVPRVFGHGDFFLGNLLAEGGRLTGVIDWDAGGPGRLPLLDLIHLRHTARHVVPDEEWGPSLIQHLLPWARSGGDEVTHAYCRRIGFELDDEALEAFALAYWLDRSSYVLRMLPQQRARKRWLLQNVGLVLDAVVGRSSPIEG